VADLRILFTMGLAGVLQAFGPEFEAAPASRLDAIFMPSVQLLQRIRAGDRGDLAILTADAVDALETESILGPRTDLARSFIGLAVRAGTPHPDITASLAADGRADLAIQQVSELLVVPVVEIVGRLPSELGGQTMFSAGLFHASPAGQALIDALVDPARDDLYRRCGLEPAGSRPPRSP